MKKITITQTQWEDIGKSAGWIEKNASEDDHVNRRRSIRVDFDDGDHLNTDINGTKQEIEDYYLNSEPQDYDINHPDKLRKPIKVTFLK